MWKCFIGGGTLQFVRCCFLLFPAVSCLKFYTQHSAGWYLSSRAFPEFRAKSLKFAKHPHTRALNMHIISLRASYYILFQAIRCGECRSQKPHCWSTWFPMLGPQGRSFWKPLGLSLNLFVSIPRQVQLQTKEWERVRQTTRALFLLLLCSSSSIHGGLLGFTSGYDFCSCIPCICILLQFFCCSGLCREFGVSLVGSLNPKLGTSGFWVCSGRQASSSSLLLLLSSVGDSEEWQEWWGMRWRRGDGFAVLCGKHWCHLLYGYYGNLSSRREPPPATLDWSLLCGRACAFSSSKLLSTCFFSGRFWSRLLKRNRWCLPRIWSQGS